MNNNIKYFLPKGLNRFSLEQREIWKHLPIECISLIGIGKVPTKQELSIRLQDLLGNQAYNIIRSASESEISHIRDNADKTYLHKFEILGTGLVELDTIQWNKDFKTGFEWPIGVYYTKLRSLTPQGSDIKIPWELSRCHHLLWLGEAYIFTHNEKYAKEVVYQISNWIENNPLMYSVNWTCAMDVAIRAVNWMYALLFIKDSEHFSEKFVSKVYSSLYQHGFFIYNNLERSIPDSNNHYMSDLVGLLYLGQLFNTTYRGKKWFKFAINVFFKETRRQTLQSGVNYERSISYHRLMTELCSYPLYMLERVGIDIPKDIKGINEKMHLFIANYSMPNGMAPLIADNDNGRFLPFVQRDFRYHNYLNDNDSLEKRIISNGCKTIYSHATLNSKKTKLYPDAGFAICRSNDAYVFLSNGGYSKCPKESDKRIGTHTHNDLLSFVLCLGAEEIIVDPGTYLYTSSVKDRNEFRSTSKHNTIVVENEEQNILSTTSVFSVERNVHIGKLTLENDTVSGYYETINSKFAHKRSIKLTECELTIDDTITKTGLNHTAKIYYHLGEGIEPSISDNKVFISTNQYNISLIPNFECNISIVRDTLSPSYGILKQSKTIIIETIFSKSKDINTTIKWTRTNNTK